MLYKDASGAMRLHSEASSSKERHSKMFSHKYTDLSKIHSHKQSFGPDTYTPWKENVASEKLDSILNIPNRFALDKSGFDGPPSEHPVILRIKDRAEELKNDSIFKGMDSSNKLDKFAY